MTGGRQLQDAKSVENILEEIINGEFPQGKSIQSVSIVSKTGLMVAGKAASSARAETFSAMAAIMFSAAEATKNDIFKDKIDYVIAVFRNTKLFISELSSSLLIVATVDRDTDDGRILENMNHIVTRTKEELVWLR
jgi:predicted regulator of Ras-like GTPase activity (Roadblock/LC7/MglB family)